MFYFILFCFILAKHYYFILYFIIQFSLYISDY